MRVAILTISDAGARGERTDTSGEAAENWARGRGYAMAARDLVPDDTVRIVARLVEWCDTDVAELVLTTGGTGLSERDITPEATRAVLEREAPGIAERIRALSIESFPRAALSRGLAGVRRKKIPINQSARLHRRRARRLPSPRSSRSSTTPSRSSVATRPITAKTGTPIATRPTPHA